MSGYIEDYCREFAEEEGISIPKKNIDKQEREREREREFQCGICYIKYRGELLGGETIREGKICRFCLEKKQKGEK
jgi:hypothetical protein